MIDPRLMTAMSDPAFYPARPDRVEVIQTHASTLFLAGEEVYKVKKTVQFGFLDFSTLEKRRHFCEEEVRLNRRLALQAYLGVVPVVRRADGTLALNADGDVVEYAVHMRRLPEKGMLARLVSQPEFDPAVLDAVARTVAAFHRRAATGGAIDAMGAPEVILRNTEENYSETQRFIGITLSADQFRLLSGYTRRFLREREALFRRRVQEGHIRDGHGDLHLDHIVITDDGVVIYDCIEFNERFRWEDAAAEAAFLAMDLDVHGYPQHAARFVQAYREASQDADFMQLLNFYKCYYAYVRGKVASLRLADPDISAEGHAAAREEAARYFALAVRYAAHAEAPLLVIMAGLTGTGKSVLARRLASFLGADMVSTDVLRKELLGIDPGEHRFDAFGEGIYQSDISRRVYDEALRRAGDRLAQGRPVVLDASFRESASRRSAAEAARKAGAPFFCVECDCPEDVVRERLTERLGRPGEASDGRWEIYLAQKAAYEPVGDEIAPGECFRVNTARPVEEMVVEILMRLRA